LACSASKTAQNLNESLNSDLKKAQQVEESKRTLDLTARLKTFPGITVRVTGANATFTIRGINSFSNAAEQPLFILDGVQLQSYDQLYESIDPRQISKIEVLRKATETQEYGFRGNYGVIRVTTER